jgi:hypothetical protein
VSGALPTVGSRHEDDLGAQLVTLRELLARKAGTLEQTLIQALWTYTAMPALAVGASSGLVLQCADSTGLAQWVSVLTAIGVLPVANGGTGLSSITADKLIVGNGTGTPLLKYAEDLTYDATRNGTGPTYQTNAASAYQWAQLFDNDTSNGLNLILDGAIAASGSLSVPAAGGVLLSNANTATVLNKTLTSGNKLRFDSAGATSGVLLQDRVGTTKQAYDDLSGITAGQTRGTRRQDLTGVAPLVGKANTAAASGVLAGIDKTAQGADIGTTNLTSSAPAGAYLLIAVLECTTAAVGTGTVTLTLSWTDDVGATTDTSVSIALTATGRSKVALPVYLASGDITYATANGGSYSTAKYALRIRVVALN